MRAQSEKIEFGIIFFLAILTWNITGVFAQAPFDNPPTEYYGGENDYIIYFREEIFTTSYTTKETVYEKYVFEIPSNNSEGVSFRVHRYRNTTLWENLNTTTLEGWTKDSTLSYTLGENHLTYIEYPYLLPNSITLTDIVSNKTFRQSAYVTAYADYFAEDTTFYSRKMQYQIQNQSARIDWDVVYSIPRNLYREYTLNVSWDFRINRAKILTRFQHSEFLMEDYGYLQKRENKTTKLSLVETSIPEPILPGKKISSFPSLLLIILLGIQIQLLKMKRKKIKKEIKKR